MFRRCWWLFPVCLFALPLLGLFVAGLLAYVTPKQYESSAVLQVRPLPVTAGLSGPATGPNFFATESEVIGAAKTIDRVVDALGLVERWALDRRRLREMITSGQIEGTDLIRIRVRAASPEDARAIAEAVSEAYRGRRNELESRRLQGAIMELRDEIHKQQDLIEDKRKVLTQILRQGTPRSQNDGELEDQLILLESQIETLLRYDGEQLLSYAADLDLPENVLRTLYPQYLDALRRLESLKQGGLGDSHPNVRQQQEIVAGMRKDIDKGVVALRETLKARLDLVQERLERLRRNTDAKADDPGAAESESARADFEAAQSLLEQLRVKEVTEEMQLRIAENSIIVHEDPAMPLAPVAPNIPLHLAYGAGIGLLAGLLLPFFLIPLVHLARRPAE